MSFYSFGPWRPDLPAVAQLDESGALRLLTASNVVPSFGCYEPQADAELASDSLTTTCQGAFACSDKNGNVNWFAGNATDLVRISSNTVAWTVVSAGGGYALTGEDYWEFAKYDNQVFATAITNDLQYMSLDAGAVFAPVGGAPPRFRHIAIVRNFLVGAGTATDPQRVQWSGIDNPQTWTVDSVTMADYQDLLGPGGWNTGLVVGLAGGDAVVMQERAVWRMLYVGPPLVFQLDPVENARGAITPGSIVQSAGYVYYLSDDGFYRFDGTTSIPIGQGKIDDTFFRDVDTSQFHRISSTADADRALVMWSYRSVSSSTPDKILVYNWQTGEWSLIEQACEYLWRALTHVGGTARLAIFDTEHRAATFTGASKAATLTTADYQLSPGRTLLTEAYPLLEGGEPTVQIGHRVNATVSLSTEAAVSLNAFGYAPLRINDRFLRFTLRVPAGVTWSRWKGLKVRAAPVGVR